MNFELFTVYQSPFEKQRIGRNNDGGYIICKIPECKYDCLLSAGICDDISFEEDFLQSVQKVPCFAFDGTVEGLPHSSNDITFIKKNIDRKETDILTNLHSYLTQYTNVFVKMDIEGAEFKWLHSLSKEHLASIQQLAIEIHYPFKGGLNSLFERLNSTHVLLHLHANCAGGKHMYEGKEYPGLLECTYVNRKWIQSSLTLNTDPLPGPLDQPNLVGVEDIDLKYPPFVHKK
jgi:hypothetical protein